jgi:hypothetical protein
VAVRGVDDDDVDMSSYQGGRALRRIPRDPDSGSDTQPPQAVLAGVGILDLLLDVLDGDQTLELEVAIDDKQLLDLVPVQNFPRGVQRCADGHRDEVLLGHDGRDRAIHVGLEAQIPVREDTDERPSPPQ